MAFVDQVAELLAAGDREAAHALVEAAPQPLDRELGRAQLALARQDATAGAAHARAALELGGGAAAHHFLAAARLYAGDADGAVDEERRAVGLDPSPRSRASLGGVLLAIGRPHDAVAVLRQVVAEAPHDADALLNLATASAKTGDYGEAIACYARAFEQRPTDQRAIQSLVAMFAEVGKWMGALAAVEMSRQGEPPGDVAVSLDLATVHIVRMITGGKFPPAGMTDDADDAVHNLAAHARTRPARVRLTAVRTLLDVDRVDEARQLLATLERGQLGDEDRATALYLDGYFAEQAGDTPKALACYSDALAADGARVEAAINASSLLLQDGSPEALAQVPALLDRVAPAQRANPNLLYNEAAFHARAGRSDEARAKLERIVQVTGGSGPHAQRARTTLDELARSR